MITDTPQVDLHFLQQSLRNRVALSSQNMFNVLDEFEETCRGKGYLLAYQDVNGFASLFKFNMENLKTQVAEIFRAMRCKVHSESDPVNKAGGLKDELARQVRLNQVMKEQVLELNQLISDHLKMSDNKLHQKDEVIRRLKQDYQRLAKAVDFEGQQPCKISKASQISIIDQEQNTDNEIRTPHQQTQSQKALDVIIEEQEMFSTSRYQTVEAKVEFEEELTEDQETIVKYKTQPNQTANFENQYTYMDNTFQSSRKSEGKSKTKFFLNDFRKLVQAQTEIQSILLGKSSSGFASGQSSLSGLSVARNESENINVPYKTCTPKKLFNKKSKPQFFSSAKKPRIKSAANFAIEERTKNKDKANSINLFKERPHSIGSSRVPSREKLKQKDMNIVNVPLSRPSSKQKLCLTIKSDHKRHYNSQQFSNRMSLKKVVQQEIHMLDLDVGDRSSSVHYHTGIKSHGSGLSFYGTHLKYEGCFKDNVRHGFGVLHFDNIQVYKGEWQRNKICGKGKLQNVHLVNRFPIPEHSILRQLTYVGEFQENRLHGSGELVFPGGDSIRSQFHDNLPQGPFQYLTNQNEVLHGCWFANR